MRVLVGDIGGTKTTIALVEIDERQVRVDAHERFDSHAFDGLEAIVEAFVKKTSARFERAGFGVAGPVFEGVAEITNLPWRIESETLAKRLAVPVRVVNDLASAALGITRLRDEDFAVINEGAPVARAPRAVLGAGTGLGEAFMVWTGAGYDVIPGEGGHSDFAPSDEAQVDLWRALAAKHGHVSNERVVSGMGIAAMYEYLRDREPAAESAAMREAIARGEDIGALVGEHALAGTDALSTRVIDLFVAAYGAEAGNMAIRLVTRGGVYLVGGIAPKLEAKLTDGRFLEAFVAKGRFRALMQSIPVRIVKHPDVALIGAAVAATR